AAADDPSSWGVKDKKLTGPGGFTIDLSKCAGKWEDTAGITDTEIRLGQSIAQSGALAIHGEIAQGMKNYYDYINATEGGIGGKKITINQKDDAYEAARAKANIDEMVETGNLFAFSSVLGTPVVLATYDKMNEYCYPNLNSATGHPAWGDPMNHPWTTGPIGVSYNTEALIWGKYLADKYPTQQLTVAALVLQNDFGVAYKNSFDAFAKSKGWKVTYENHDPQAPQIINEMTTLASTNADVIILMTASGFCTQGFTALAQSTWKPKEKIAPQTCAALNFWHPAGQAAVDWVVETPVYDITEPSDQNQPFVKLARENLQKAGLEPTAQRGNGYIYAWPMVDALKRAAKMPGGLSRTNLILAARALRGAEKHPMVREGIPYEMWGAQDAYPVEGAIFARYQLPAGQEKGSLVPFGQVVDQNGQTPNCAWDGKVCK
ncbi:MAG: ABC transporter substrate-binding protein, partial [Acidimicrobiales bacterium]